MITCPNTIINSIATHVLAPWPYLHRGGDDVAVDDRVGFVGTADLHFLYARSNVNFRCDQAVVDAWFCAD